ncbi:Rieske (2Fe-2S) protein [candidate division KSB1 bacterium]|nr:Rieske (2Fe-2S) protein [candidate division KSB1 bacterium]
MKPSRRNFLQKTATISLAVVCGGVNALLSGCSSYRYAAYTTHERDLVVAKTDFELDPFVLVRYPAFPASIYILKISEDKYSALLLECTHKRCEVRPSPEILICPCHGSEYSNTGEVLKSPAEKELTSFPVRTDNENIYIQIM